jgi:hypothetical protein
MVVNRTEIIQQKGTWMDPENRPFLFRGVCEKPGTKLINAQLKTLGQAPDVSRVQKRTGHFAAVGALGAIDFPGYFPIDLMNRMIDPPNGKTRSLEKAAESPIGLLTFFRELLNSLDVRFRLYMSERNMVPQASVKPSFGPDPESSVLRRFWMPDQGLPWTLDQVQGRL